MMTAPTKATTASTATATRTRRHFIPPHYRGAKKRSARSPARCRRGALPALEGVVQARRETGFFDLAVLDAEACLSRQLADLPGPQLLAGYGGVHRHLVAFGLDLGDLDDLHLGVEAVLVPAADGLPALEHAFHEVDRGVLGIEVQATLQVLLAHSIEVGLDQRLRRGLFGDLLLFHLLPPSLLSMPTAFGAGRPGLEAEAHPLLAQRVFLLAQFAQALRDPPFKLGLQARRQLRLFVRQVVRLPGIGDEVVELARGVAVEVWLPGEDELVSAGAQAPLGLPGALHADALLQSTVGRLTGGVAPVADAVHLVGDPAG